MMKKDEWTKEDEEALAALLERRDFCELQRRAKLMGLLDSFFYRGTDIDDVANNLIARADEYIEALARFATSKDN